MMFHLNLAPEQSALNRDHFRQRFLRHCAHVDRRLEDRSYLADEFSIADVALFPIIAARADIIAAATGLRHLKSWQARVGERSLTAHGMAVNG